MKKIFAITLLVLLVACKGPTTQLPMITKAELEQETARHKELAREEKYEEQEDVEVTPKMKKRFRAIAARISKAARGLCRDIEVKGCDYDFILRNKPTINAYANGKRMTVFAGMVAFTKNDDELAHVMAHEYAHNMMKHVQKQRENAQIGYLLGAVVDAAFRAKGVDSEGAGREFGTNYASLKYSPEFEHEADYVGLYIEARAGYDISKAADLWRRMSVMDKDGIYTRDTHPTNPERFVEITKTVEEIKEKKAAHKPLVPVFKKES